MTFTNKTSYRKFIYQFVGGTIGYRHGQGLNTEA